MSNPLYSFRPYPSLVRLWVGVIVIVVSTGFILDILNVSKNSSKGHMGLALVTLAFALLLTGVLGLVRRPNAGDVPRWLQPAWSRMGMVVLAFLAMGLLIYRPVDAFVLKKMTRSAVKLDRQCYGALSSLSRAHLYVRKNNFSSAITSLREARKGIIRLGPIRANCEDFEGYLTRWIDHLQNSTKGVLVKKDSWFKRWVKDLATFPEDMRPEMQEFYSAYAATRPLRWEVAERVHSAQTVTASGQGSRLRDSDQFVDGSVSEDGEIAFTLPTHGQRIILNPVIENRGVYYRCRATPEEHIPSDCRGEDFVRLE